jgi:antitoxin VapB
MREATRIGATGADVFRAAVAAYASAGFPDEWRLHHQGGPIAYRPREAIVTPDALEPFAAGMAFAYNPSITGTKVEDTFLLEVDGSHRTLTRDPRWPAEAGGTPAIWVREA